MKTRQTKFDQCFSTFPEIHTPDNFLNFWQSAIDDLKKYPVSPKTKMQLKKSIGKQSQIEVQFNGYGNTPLKGVLTLPRRQKKVPVILTIDDYLSDFDRSKEYSEAGFAHFALLLRSHEHYPFRRQLENGKEAPPPRFFYEAGLTPIDSSYLFLSILDGVRAVDLLRLQKTIDFSKIGIIGKGLGAAVAAFVTIFKKTNIKGLVVERMGYVNLSRWLQDSRSSGAAEIDALLHQIESQRIKNRIKKEINYFDPLHIAEKIGVPVLSSTGLEDEMNPPEHAFAFFHHLRTDKTMEIYPTEESDPDGMTQRKKSIEFLAPLLSGKK